MGFDRPIFGEQREDAGQDGAEFFDLIVAVPADIDAAGMAGGEAGGDVVAENGAERGAGDARDFGSFERLHVRAGGLQPRDAVREVEEKLVGEPGDPRASRIGAEEEEGFVEADGFGRGAEPPLGGSGQEFFELPVSPWPKLAFQASRRSSRRIKTIRSLPLGTTQE